MDFGMNFEGKVGIVTGAGSGIGRATALGFATLGGTVVVADINTENATHVAEAIAAQSGKALAMTVDVTKPADIDRMVAETKAAFGRIDFLHNNAFGLPATASTSAEASGRLADVEEGVWSYMIDVGLTAVWRAMKRVLPITCPEARSTVANATDSPRFCASKILSTRV